MTIQIYSILEVDGIVSRRCKDFTGDFFEHLKLVSNTYYESLELRDELDRLASKCVATVQTYDNETTNSEAFELGATQV